jgi:multiple sugar transport system ATP-binding protein
MMGGDILQLAPPEEIYADPQDLRVATFIGSPRINTVAVDIAEDGHVRIGEQRLALSSPHRGAATLALRPEHLSVAQDGIALAIEHIEFLGDSLLVHGRVAAGRMEGGRAEAGDMPVILRLAAAGSRRLERGGIIRFSFDPERALLFDRNGKRVPLARAGTIALAEKRAAHG